MAIDPSIALQAGKTQTQFDPLAIGQFNLQRQAAARQAALQERVLANEDKQTAEQEQLNSLLRQGGTPQEISNRLMQAGYVDQAQKINANESQLKSSQLDQQSKGLKLIADTSGLLAANPTEANALQLFNGLQQQTGHNFDADRQEILAMRNNPELIRQYALRHGLSAKEQLAQTRETNTGNAIRREQIDPVTNQVLSTENIPINMTEQQRQQLGINQQELGLKKQELALKQRELEQKLASPANIPLSKGQEALDKDFAKEYSDFVAQGGAADVNKNIEQLNLAAENLKKDDTLTGSIRGLAPDWIRATTNPKAIATREAVEEIAQRNLRLVLGAQFTQKEGERLIARAFNPLLSTEENSRRVKRLGEQISKAAKVKMEAAKYFEEHGTLVGWKGKLPSISDFDTSSPPPIKGQGTRFKEKPTAAMAGIDARLYDEDKKRWEVSNGKEWIPE